MLLDRSTFKNEEKKLKRHYKEKEMLKKIILLIKESSSYDELVINPFSKMYGFEILRYDMSGYYSFNWWYDTAYLSYRKRKKFSYFRIYYNESL